MKLLASGRNGQSIVGGAMRMEGGAVRREDGALACDWLEWGSARRKVSETTEDKFHWLLLVTGREVMRTVAVASYIQAVEARKPVKF